MPIGVSPLTFFAALGAVIERRQQHRETWPLVGVAPERGIAARLHGRRPVSRRAALPARRCARPGFVIGLAGNQPEAGRGGAARARRVDRAGGVVGAVGRGEARRRRSSSGSSPSWAGRPARSRTSVTGSTTTCSPPRPPACAVCSSVAGPGATSTPRGPRRRRPTSGSSLSTSSSPRCHGVADALAHLLREPASDSCPEAT